MTCYAPNRAFEGPVLEPGKVNVVWKQADSLRGVELMLPCGKCIGCQLDRSRQWAIRCVHEASLYSDNCFITLTYDDEYLPANRSLDVREFQLFMKRLRKRFPVPKPGIRFFHCGEYGERFGRPHFHALLFNFDFPDKVLRTVRNGHNVYTSDILSSLWGKGFCSIGSVTIESAAYVARYVLKKVFGDDADKHYGGRKPEYITMSRRPGVGTGWYEKFHTDVYPSDEVIVNGVAVKPPRFYDNLLDSVDADMFKSVKLERKRDGIARNLPKLVRGYRGAFELVSESDSVRMRAKEQVKLASISTLSRDLE